MMNIRNPKYSPESVKAVLSDGQLLLNAEISPKIIMFFIFEKKVDRRNLTMREIKQ